MRLSMPITRARIRNHLHYSFWMYLLLIALALFGWNLIYTTTQYRTPEARKVEFFAEGSAYGDDGPQALADRVHAEAMPGMEQVTATALTIDQTYGDMQLVVWVSAGQGDVYLLTREHFLSMAQNGAMLDLGPYVADGTLHAEGLDLQAGYTQVNSEGANRLMGIPADSLTGLAAYGLDGQGKVLCALLNNGNDPYTLKFIDYLLTNLR